MPAVSVEVPGAITVSAHLLFDIARKLPDGRRSAWKPPTIA
jgi:DNA polymerase-3 subunit beta